VNVDALLQSAFGSRGIEMFTGDRVRRPGACQEAGARHLPARAADARAGPERAVAFEDSSNGLRAAVAAGLWTVVTPTFWTEGSDFSAAGLVLPRLGDPSRPLPHEPGTALQTQAWLGFDELLDLARPARPLSSVQALYQGATR
jgi:hypothetical protein